MPGLVVPQDEEDDAELGELAPEEAEVRLAVLGVGRVADVAQQCEVRRLGRYVEDVVGHGTLQVEVRDYLYRDHGCRDACSGGGKKENACVGRW